MALYVGVSVVIGILAVWGGMALSNISPEATKIRKRPAAMTGLFFCYMFMQLVAPSAVTIAVATDAIICTMNLIVSLLVIVFKILG